MTDKVKISKVEMDELGDIKLKLTLDQAKGLQKILNDTFPEKVVQPIPVSYTITYPGWEVAWGGDTGTLSLSTGG